MTLPHIFTLSIKDSFSPSVLWISLFSFVATLIFFAASVYGLFGGVEALSLEVAQWIEGFEGRLENNWLFGFLSFIVIAKTLIMALFFLSSAMVVYYLFLMVYSVFVGFFAGYFIKEVAQRYYPRVQFLGLSLPYYLWTLFKVILLTVVLFIVFSPLLFIPLLNIMLLIPVYYMFHKLLVLEVASSIFSKVEYERLQKKFGGQNRALSALCFALTLIPVVGVIIYPYYVIVMSHFLLGKAEELRA